MENNKFQKVMNFCLTIGVRIISIIIGIIGILSIFITAYFRIVNYSSSDEKTYFKYSFGIKEILITVFAILIIYLLVKVVLKKIPSKILCIILLICSSIPFIFWVKTLNLAPDADQKMIHEMALAFCRRWCRSLFAYWIVSIFVSIPIWNNIVCINCLQCFWTEFYEYFINKLRMFSY